MPTKEWLEEMVTVWVSRENRDRINALRKKTECRSADDVFEMLIAYWELKAKK